MQIFLRPKYLGLKTHSKHEHLKKYDGRMDALKMDRLIYLFIGFGRLYLTIVMLLFSISVDRANKVPENKG